MKEVLGVFKTDTVAIETIFGSPSSYYQIPDYQRPYDWGDDEIEQLWDDIHDAFVTGEKYYFLGPMILAKSKDGYLEVIDGQQRLTTLTILFCVVRDFYFKQMGKKSEILKNQILDAIHSGVKKRFRLRLITQEHYQIQFENEILKKTMLPQGELTKKEKEKLKYKFMNAASILKINLDELSSKSGISQVTKLMQYIMDRVVFATITCSDRVSAIKIFQIINTRGLELSLSDLFKSSMMGKLDKKGHRQFMLLWQDLVNITDRNDETVTDLLTYYGYYWLGRKPKYSLYSEFDKKLFKEKSDKIIYELKKFSEYYDWMMGQRSKAIYSLRYLPDNVFWKAILLAAKMEELPNFKKLSEELRKLYFSFWIAGYSTAKTRNFSFKLINAIKEGKGLDAIEKEIEHKIEEDDVIKYAKESLEEDAYQKGWLKPLLVLIEYEQTDESVMIEYGRNLHVDHILPEEWKKKPYWRGKWSDEETNRWLNKIGNLTLLSGKKNIGASNEAFPEKKKIYEGKGGEGTTAFEISKRVLKYSSWTEKEAKERQKWLIRQATRVLNLK